MREEEAFVLVASMVVCVALVWLGLRAKQRSDRMKLLAKALDKHHLDEEARAVLRRELTGDGRKGHTAPEPPPFRSQLLQQFTLITRNAVFVVGWVTMFIGLGLLISGDRHMVEGGVVTLAIGFGVATIPLALREVRTRTGA